MWNDLFKRWLDVMTWLMTGAAPNQDSERTTDSSESADRGSSTTTSRETGAAGQSSQGSASSGSAAQATSGSGSKQAAAASAPAGATASAAQQGQASAGKAQGSSDDLTAIKGVGPAIRDRLNASGINSFHDLASADAKELSDKLREQMVISEKRVQEWIDQARQHTT